MNKPNNRFNSSISPIDAKADALNKKQQIEDAGNQPGTPQTYDSAGQYGSGFVNLSHLLNLNQASGFNSAKDLAKRTNDTGYSALGGITSAEGSFNNDVSNAEVNAGNYMAPGDNFAKGGGSVQGMIDKANQGYKGPNDLTQQSGYADLSKKVMDAQDMAKNAAGGGYGLAAQIGKETGQSATQANAGAFYMGVNNRMTKRAGDQFKNLSAALDDANSRALARSSQARQNTSNAADTLTDYEKRRQDYWGQIDQNAAKDQDNKALAADRLDTQNREDVLQQNAVGGHRPQELQADEQRDVNKKRGMEGGLADHGMSWDEWESLGRPNMNSPAARKWMHDHGYDSYYGDAGNGGV